MTVQFVGPEQLVNTTTENTQSQASITTLSDGRYVVTWSSFTGNNPYDYDIRGRIYNADGTSAGDDFLINTTTAGTQSAPSVAALPDGGFVVTWDHNSGLGAQTGAYGRIYGADGTAGEEFLAAGTTGGWGYVAGTTVAVNDDGLIFVAWSGTSARLYSADGTPVPVDFDPITDEPVYVFPVNATTEGAHVLPSVAALEDGRFAAIWTSLDAVGYPDIGSIRGRIFNGATGGTEFVVNTTMADAYGEASIAALPNGGFVVTWSSSEDSAEIRGRIFTADGVPLGNDFLVNTTLVYNQYTPAATGLSDGKFIVAWFSEGGDGTAGNARDIRARVFDSDGTPVGDDFIVNSSIGNEERPSVAALPDGRFVITWDSTTAEDGSGWGINAQVFALAASTDTIDFSTGLWVYTGGAFDLDAPASSVAVDLSAGTYTAHNGVHSSRGLGVEAVNVVGTSGTDELIGSSVANVLDGGGGTDTLIGRLGDDTYYVDVASDVVTEVADEGYDRVYARASYVLGAGQSIELLATSKQAATTAINLTGNNISQRVNGNAGNNVLDGGGGIDQLYGFAGNDTFYVSHASDQVFEAAGQGTDTVYARTSYALAAGQSIEVLATSKQAATTAIDLTGNALSQIIRGNAGNNVLDGGGGGDQLYGFGGNDTFYVSHASDQVFEAAGQGTDTVYARTSYVLAAGQSIEVLATSKQAATTAIDLTGNALSQVIRGNAGNNVLDGGGGGDQLYGFDGSDTYYVNHASDQVFEEEGFYGPDTIWASVNYTLSAGQDIEYLHTTANMTGNEFSQTLYGNYNDNVLDGGGGGDVGIRGDSLSGGFGNDTYYVNHYNDSVDESVGQGTDTVYARTTYSIFGYSGPSIEVLATSRVAGTEAIHLVGNDFGQTIRGNAGANMLYGFGGSDIIHGGLGNDTLVGGLGVDTFVFDTALNPATNVDTITDFNIASDKMQLENAIFTALTATGPLAASAFHVGTSAADAADRIIYDSANGWLSYDADGTGAGSATHFATLSTGLALTAGHFVVV